MQSGRETTQAHKFWTFQVNETSQFNSTPTKQLPALGKDSCRLLAVGCKPAVDAHGAGELKRDQIWDTVEHLPSDHESTNAEKKTPDHSWKAQFLVGAAQAAAVLSQLFNEVLLLAALLQLLLLLLSRAFQKKQSLPASWVYSAVALLSWFKHSVKMEWN